MDLIDRQQAIDAIEEQDIPEDMCVFEILSHIELAIGTLPSAQPEERTDKRTETHTCDCISRKDAIRWIKTECNPYGKPTLDFESGKRVIKHLKQMPPAQPEPERTMEEFMYGQDMGNPEDGSL